MDKAECERFTPEKFAIFCLGNMYRKVRDSPDKRILLGELYESLAERVEDRYGIPRGQFSSVHHPFHWFMFSDGNGSPLKLVQEPRADGTNFYAEFEKDLDENKLLGMYENFMRKYGHYLETRLGGVELNRTRN